MREPSELLYDSEATLRLVDKAILDMGALDADEPKVDPTRSGMALLQCDTRQPSGLTEISEHLTRGYAGILGVVDSLRQSRRHLERATVDNLKHTNDKLREVSDATESAATDILNGLDNLTSSLDALDTCAQERPEPDARAAKIRGTMREELFTLVGHMQFQDITSQQLHYASAVICDMEARLAQLARVFDPAAFGAAASPEATPLASDSANTFDPHASTHNRAARQAVADEIIAESLAAS
ncbi:MAG: hypothetical protein ABIZ91_09600 [Gemmatimonadaceae bacterium]